MKVIFGIIVLILNFMGYLAIYEIGKSLITGVHWNIRSTGIQKEINERQTQSIQLTAIVSSDALNIRDVSSE